MGRERRIQSENIKRDQRLRQVHPPASADRNDSCVMLQAPPKERLSKATTVRSMGVKAEISQLTAWIAMKFGTFMSPSG